MAYKDPIMILKLWAEYKSFNIFLINSCLKIKRNVSKLPKTQTFENYGYWCTFSTHTNGDPGQNPWSMCFNPRKVLLNNFLVLFEIQFDMEIWIQLFDELV